MPHPSPATWSWGLKTFLVSKAKMLCDQHLTKLHLILSWSLRLRVSDFPSPPLCPPVDATGPAHLASSLDGVFPEVGSRTGVKVSRIKLGEREDLT